METAEAGLVSVPGPTIKGQSRTVEILVSVATVLVTGILVYITCFDVSSGI